MAILAPDEIVVVLGVEIEVLHVASGFNGYICLPCRLLLRFGRHNERIVVALPALEAC